MGSFCHVVYNFLLCVVLVNISLTGLILGQWSQIWDTFQPKHSHTWIWRSFLIRPPGQNPSVLLPNVDSLCAWSRTIYRQQLGDHTTISYYIETDTNHSSYLEFWKLWTRDWPLITHLPRTQPQKYISNKLTIIIKICHLYHLVWNYSGAFVETLLRGPFHSYINIYNDYLKKVPFRSSLFYPTREQLWKVKENSLHTFSFTLLLKLDFPFPNLLNDFSIEILFVFT